MLQFVNATDQDLWVAYMFLAQDVCGGEGGDWQAIGWFHMSPGGSTIPYANDLSDVDNRYWCYYAENANRSRVWAGPYPVYVPEDGGPSTIAIISGTRTHVLSACDCLTLVTTIISL